MKNEYFILGRVVQKMIDQGYSQVHVYNKFGFIKLNSNYILVSQKRGKNTKIYFKIILVGIKAFMANPKLYDDGPARLRDWGITHVNSPIWSMLYLIPNKVYE